MMYYFNSELLSRLHQVVNMKIKDLAASIGMDYHKLYRRMKDGDIELLMLKEICDKMKLPIGHFFRTSEEPQQLPLPESKYKPAKMNTDYLVMLFRGAEKSPAGMSLRDTNGLLGFAREVMPSCVQGTVTVKAKQLVEWCNALLINVSEVIQDPMRPIPDLYSVKNNIARRELVAIREASRREVSRVNQENEELKAKIAQLQQENRELRQELPGIGIAASPGVDYQKSAE